MALKDNIRDLIKEKAEKHYTKDFSKLGSYQLSAATGYTYITELFNDYNPDILPENWEKLEDYCVDGKDGNGVDLTDDITLYKGQFYEKISLFNYFII